ncbi:hypothetical protein JF531_13200 [Microbacterium esteraromaticum]|uniref:hypothetical protein n=1 Tax=Microbacterium esteraromaticum TaxID=57043 RepID=UPI001A8DA59D|nr:hypothetical protein [Microbacterium esteraromaticum]MBN8425479.1 hypothetical protein [Microbacterium esteraromaticum]
MKRSSTILAALTTAVALVLSGPAALATDSPPEPSADIAAVMAAVPGGVLLDAHHATWPALGLEMTSASGVSTRTLSSSAVGSSAVGTASVGSCASGRVCAFSGGNLSGSRLSWSTCGTFSISAFTVRSIANARSTGYLQARSGTTVRATAKAGASANVFGSVTNVRCVS